MVPLIGRDLYDRLRATRASLPERGVSNVAQVFVPVGPAEEASGAASLRVLFVGRATRGFDEEALSSYEGAARRAEELVMQVYVPDGTAPQPSDFWRFARNVLRAALDSLREAGSSRFSDHLGWSNLAKIGDTKGNATPLSLSVQRELCHEALRSEIAVMNPHAMVLATGKYAEEEVLAPVFGSQGWKWEQTGRAEWRWKAADPLCPLVFRTEHPQGKHDMGDTAIAIGARIAEGIR